MNTFNPLLVHSNHLRTKSMKLDFDPSRDFWKWRGEVRGKLKELLGDEPERVPLNIRIEYEKTTDLYKEIRYIFASEEYCDVPCHSVKSS